VIPEGNVIGVGIDAVDVDRFRVVLGRRRGFAERVFTAAERAEAAARHDPVPGLAAPRLIAGIITTPLLVGIANVAGCIAGLLAARATVGLGPDAFLFGARLFWHNWDLFYSLMKGLVFGFIIPLISVYMGFGTRGGAEGVGRATTTSVVFMIISVLVLDALFPPLFLN